MNIHFKEKSSQQYRNKETHILQIEEERVYSTNHAQVCLNDSQPHSSFSEHVKLPFHILVSQHSQIGHGE